MKKQLSVLFNKFLKEDLINMFGDEYYIKVNSLDFSTQKKCYVLDITLICKNCSDEDLEVFYPYGLDFIIDQCWKFLAIEEPLMVIKSIDFEKIN